MEFEGTVYKMLPLTKGTSARGEWQRQDVVFEMQDGSFARKICVTFFNRPDDVAKLKEGAVYHVSVNIESREYNGRWYTDIRAWRLQPQQPQSVDAPAAAPMPDLPPIGGQAPSLASASAPTSPADDLPSVPVNRKAACLRRRLFAIESSCGDYLTCLTIASNAFGSFIAKSASTLRFSTIPLALSLPINCE